MQGGTSADRNVDLTSALQPAKRFEALMTVDAELRERVAELKAVRSTAAWSRP